MLPTLFAYRTSLLLTLCVLILSLYPFSELPKIEVRFADKYTHFIIYGGYAFVLWIESIFAIAPSKRISLWMLCVVWPILFGGLNEVLQSTLTTTRQGELYDFLANTLGVLLVIPLGRYLLRRYGH